MGISDVQEQSGDQNIHKNRVHKVLAHSYLTYFVFFLVGFILDFVWPIKLFENTNIVSLGGLMLFLGTLLILWAQRSSLAINKENINKETFTNGPYRYTRNPTNLGLFLLMLGFGIIANAFFIIIFSVFSLLIGKLVFIKKEEEILTEKYGAPYLEYKKLVKF